MIFQFDHNVFIVVIVFNAQGDEVIKKVCCMIEPPRRLNEKDV
jgi:hypothetical protein